MTRRILALAAALLAATALAAGAQPASDYLPREPLPAERPQPPASPGPAGPVAPPQNPGKEPSFVLRGVTLEGATAVSRDDLAPLWAPLIGQPVTLATLGELADRIAAAYRARGYVLSQAVLPAQTIEDGTVRVQVIEGFIDQVGIEGGTPGQQAAAARLFAPVASDRPLQLKTLERSVLLSRDTFGGSVETLLQPSAATFGAADLGVALDPDRFTGFAAADNRGSRLYGPVTLSAGGSAYNLLGQNERLDGLVAFAPYQASLAYGEAVLDLPLPFLTGSLLDGGRLELRVDASRGEPDLAKSGSPDLTVTTNQTDLSAGLVVPFIRTRSQNLYGRVGLDWQDSESVTGFAGSAENSTDRLLVLRAQVSWDVADRFGGVTLIDAGLRQGIDAGGARIEAEGPAAGNPDFTLATLTLSRLQRLGRGDWSLYAEAIGQLAAQVLPNSERFALGNSTIGRGFAPGNTTGDFGLGRKARTAPATARDQARRRGAGGRALRLHRLRPRLRPLGGARRNHQREPRLGRDRRPHRPAAMADHHPRDRPPDRRHRHRHHRSRPRNPVLHRRRRPLLKRSPPRSQ